MTNIEHQNAELWSFIIKDQNDFKVKTRYIINGTSEIIIRNIENIQQLNLSVGQVVIGQITPNNCFQIKHIKIF